jgi:hypothetical protein
MEFISETNAAMLARLGLDSIGAATGPDWPLFPRPYYSLHPTTRYNWEENILSYRSLVELIPKSKTVGYSLFRPFLSSSLERTRR